MEESPKLEVIKIPEASLEEDKNQDENIVRNTILTDSRRGMQNTELRNT